MKWKALRTIRRGKKIGREDINLEQDYKNVFVDDTQLLAYREFFNFHEEFPFSYLYLLAQRSQVAMMIDSRFTISIPGMIHISNLLEQTADIVSDKPFVLQVNCVIPSKETGSLHPEFEVLYFQDDHQVARCKSNYLVKRSSKKQTITSQKKQYILTNLLDETKIIKSDEWVLHKSSGKLYAKVSGDNNPIHSSKLFAKLLGLKQPIIHE